MLVGMNVLHVDVQLDIDQIWKIINVKDVDKESCGNRFTVLFRKEITMGEYSTYDTETGEFTQVYELEKCLRAIRVRNSDNERHIKYLEEENKKLKENNYKDEELSKMKQQLDEMQKDYWRGFPISKDEENAIEEWKKKHDEDVHGLTTNNLRMKAEGVSGGRYSYHFVPTALGTSGVIKCSCGAKFEFQEIG